jgi:hypothetical protein
MDNFNGILRAVRCLLIIRYLLCLCASWASMGSGVQKPPLPATRPESAQERAQKAPVFSANPPENKTLLFTTRGPLYTNLCMPTSALPLRPLTCTPRSKKTRMSRIFSRPILAKVLLPHPKSPSVSPLRILKALTRSETRSCKHAVVDG